jgi:manganese/zinc/iron transport system substrate-binding protein
MIDRRSLLGLLVATPLSAALTGQVLAATPAVVATTSMIGDAARRLTGAEVPALLGPGMDPHSHRPTRGDILALARADLILWHGLHLEAQLIEVLGELAQKKTVVPVADALPKELLRTDPTYPDRPDPHVWMDPALWHQVVAEIGRALTGAGYDVTATASAYATEIAALGDYSATVLNTVPAERRVLVTAHDAFGYFGRAYGWQVEGIQGISTDSEAGLVRIGDLVDLLVARNIPAVFVESSVSDRAIRALIEGAAAQGHEVVIGGELFSDAMGQEGSHEGTWIGMIDHNVTTITRALGGDAPQRGMLGKLGGVS